MSSKSANYCFPSPKNNVGLLMLSEVSDNSMQVYLILPENKHVNDVLFLAVFCTQ